MLRVSVKVDKNLWKSLAVIYFTSRCHFEMLKNCLSKVKGILPIIMVSLWLVENGLKMKVPCAKLCEFLTVCPRRGGSKIKVARGKLLIWYRLNGSLLINISHTLIGDSCFLAWARAFTANVFFLFRPLNSCLPFRDMNERLLGIWI